MNETIFRKYDIRGIADADLTDPVIERIGQAYGQMATSRQGEGAHHRVAIGRDARDSSQRIFEALARGLARASVEVVDLGMVPTPLVYFAHFAREDLDGAVQITGSHNPAEYNGLKMMIGRQALHGEDIQQLGAMSAALPTLAQSITPTVTRWEDLLDVYAAWMVEHVQPGDRALRVVLDSGNGVAGLIAPRVVRSVFDVQVTELFSEPDATFPHHHPDPAVEENLTHLIEAVQSKGADLGVAYDGDGDRVGVIDEHGTIIWGDRLMILLSRQVLRENPGATIIGEVKCSQTLFDDIEQHGGEPIMSAVGHSLIKAKIKETGAKLAGEMSGHIFFNDRYFGFDDAVYATCRVLEILSRSDKSLSELMADVPTTYATPEIRVECDESIKFEIPTTVAHHFQQQDMEVNTIDGARVHFAQGWGLVRASNTQPVLVLRAEATSPELRDQYLAQLKDAVAKAR